MEGKKKITGIVFSDLGEAASFMGLEWVQRLLTERLGFVPFAGTLNLRLTSKQGVDLWRELQQSMKGVDLPSPDPTFCHARAYVAQIEKGVGLHEENRHVAVLVPEVKGYPVDKLEVIAPFHVKQSLKVDDGDPLTLEFFEDKQ